MRASYNASQGVYGSTRIFLDLGTQARPAASIGRRSFRSCSNVTRISADGAKHRVLKVSKNPREMLTTASDSQIELHTDRNQTLALVDGVRDLADGRALLRGAVALNHRTADRVLVVSLPGKGTFEFRLRLPAEPRRSEQFGPWHLADRIASPMTGAVAPQDGYTIRYRVL